VAGLEHAGTAPVATAGQALKRLAILVFAVVVVAIVAASFAVAFRGSLTAVVKALGGANVVAMIANLPLWARVLLPAAGGLGAGLVGLWTARQRGASGVGFVMEAIVLGRARVPLVRSMLQAVASWLAIATGNSLGREGPLIQFGAAAGEGARRWLRLDDASARLVLAAGVAAGFASAYNAPIAATLFVVEVVTGVVALEATVPVLVASVIATVVVRCATGAGPLYGFRAIAAPDPVELFAFAGLGLVAAGLGVGFLRLLSRADGWWRKLPQPARSAAGGALCGVFLCVLPDVAGNGFEEVTSLLDGHLAIAAVAWLLLAKPFATAASVGSGNPGGVFTPTLLLGACTGALYAAGLHAVLGDQIASPAAYVIVGLAAALAATTHAPVMAAVLGCELSGDWALALPLLVACALAAALARRLYIDSVYTAELTRRGLRWRLTLDGRRVVESQQHVTDVV
jgi:chloride channel protein, CIC family